MWIPQTIKEAKAKNWLDVGLVKIEFEGKIRVVRKFTSGVYVVYFNQKNGMFLTGGKLLPKGGKPNGFKHPKREGG